MEKQTVSTPTPIKSRRRVRKRPIELQLQRALLEAEDACQPGVDANLRVLIQRRCEILSHLYRTNTAGKLLQARERVKVLEAENAHLRAELAVAQGGSPEAARLRRIIQESGGNNASV